LVPPFWAATEKEEALKIDLDAVSLPIGPFEISTNNFSAFKPRTLFVAVKENEALNRLKQAVDQQLSVADYKIKKESRPFHPHITIATRDIPKKDFAEAWGHFEGKQLMETVEAKELSLLKHNGRTWDVVYASAFRG
ncbi:MAG TPA: 2'-5' RNA ligase family protein, partial [Flavisolibacter sp.]|nr:2'-5' RNA ligase family protein [Flavisolibacter sp.]